MRQRILLGHFREVRLEKLAGVDPIYTANAKAPTLHAVVALTERTVSTKPTRVRQQCRTQGGKCRLLSRPGQCNGVKFDETEGALKRTVRQNKYRQCSNVNEMNACMSFQAVFCERVTLVGSLHLSTVVIATTRSSSTTMQLVRAMAKWLSSSAT